LGRVAVSVSPSGLLFPYYLGVFRALDELGVLEGAVLAGSSGGALMGAFVCSGLSVAQAETATKSLYSAVMQQVNRQDLLQLLRKVLQVRSQPHPQCLTVDVTELYGTSCGTASLSVRRGEAPPQAEFPEDAHVRASGRLAIAVTQFQPEFKGLVLDEFQSKVQTLRLPHGCVGMERRKHMFC
jgi:hypothetical protein